MYYHDPVVSILVIYLVSKAVVLCVLLICYLFAPEKERPAPVSQEKAAATRLTLTLTNPRAQRPEPCRHRKTALQQTVEETFSSN
ncbi:hypothetical protein F0L74_20540 [Chitinophaga agrisoli]|uniref:Uncharacterized protein n=1 Tax=Chitinophaga agrisoli TaxID=2607653 RepID=A0A5B2VI77_9BACT|nr:hypothetical protein [Chitinophaga agrisoli]KAA2238615.1 hypothetical protein F0L74_20540 [Chitinophaga agrisoli]